MAIAPTYWNSGRGTRINVGGLKGPQLQRVQTLANSGYGTRAQKIANTLNTRIAKASVTPTVAPLSTPPAPAATPAPTASAPVANNNTGNVLFPAAQSFEKGYAGDPLYQWQLKEGLDQADKSLAARGLTNSGAGIKQELNIQGQVAANATNREQALAQANADRLAGIQENESNRLATGQQNQWNNVLNLAQLMSNQSPYQSGLAGLNNTANITQDQANSLAKWLASNYAHSGGGGGGGSAPTPISVPGSPDYSNITPTQINANTASNNGWINLLTSSLGSLFGGK